jgi:putative selenium metabolism protein SsnA
MAHTILVGNGTVFTLGESGQVIEKGGVLFEGGTIVEVGDTSQLRPKADEFIDVEGRLIMPGMICAHHHLYSTFACGISAEPASNFVEVLEKLWWKLDRALDLDDIYYSAMIPLARCIRSGTTTIIDHHASPQAISGSLARIGEAVQQAGIRASLCYEVTDRNGADGAKNGIDENAAWLEQCKTSDGKLHGMVGIHAAMTVGPETLAACVELAKKYHTGVHIHVAEDGADQRDSLAKYGMRIIERLQQVGALGPNSIAVHCVHVDEREIELLAKSNTIVVHNPQSNMNNAVGCAAVPSMIAKGVRVGLGTDGMTSNMFEEARTSLFIRHHHAVNPATGFGETVKMQFENNAQIASSFFGKKLGVLETGAAADLIVVDYVPFTPTHPHNAYGHILFGAAAERVHTTICDGKVLMRDGKLQTIDHIEISQQARTHSPKTWQRFNSL